MADTEGRRDLRDREMQARMLGLHDEQLRRHEERLEALGQRADRIDGRVALVQEQQRYANQTNKLIVATLKRVDATNERLACTNEHLSVAVTGLTERLGELRAEHQKDVRELAADIGRRADERAAEDKALAAELAKDRKRWPRVLAWSLASTGLLVAGWVLVHWPWLIDLMDVAGDLPALVERLKAVTP